jgi:pyruvate/2-oxoglutarate dehydrogenase complex dihydrolipoamide acyltransferase (E2) component
MIPITIPKLGLTMESAKLARWLHHSGDEVTEGAPVLVIETDKVTYDVPAPASGILHLVAPEGKTCSVEETVGYVAQDQEEYERIVKQYPSPAGEAVEILPDEEPSAGPSPGLASAARFKASPLARAMAGEHHLDLSSITGTGPGGRIVRSDILAALGEKAKVAAKRIEELAEPGPGAQKEIRESIPIRGVRRIIFDNMFQSLSQSAQLTLHTEASAEALLGLRDRLTIEGQKVSFNAILVKTAAMALRLHPKVNASVEKDTIQVWKQIHVGLAMEANDALIVPVVRTPDRKTIRDIDREIADLIKRLRENRLSPDDLLNGTFTITNLGFADVDFFTPIIRPPESAILGVGRIVKKPVVSKKDTLVLEPRVSLSLTFDHRIIDGAPAARFLKTIKDMIEDPLLLIS